MTLTKIFSKEGLSSFCKKKVQSNVKKIGPDQKTSKPASCLVRNMTKNRRGQKLVKIQNNQENRLVDIVDQFSTKKKKKRRKKATHQASRKKREEEDEDEQKEEWISLTRPKSNAK